MDFPSLDPSEDDFLTLETVDLPEKVVIHQAEMKMTPPQSAESSIAGFPPYLERHIYTIYENEDERSAFPLELRKKRALYQLALCSLHKET